MERKREAWRLRLTGLSQSEIAAKLGVDQKTISRDLHEMLALARAEDAADVQAAYDLEKKRLDALLAKLEEGADPKVVLAALRICESRRRLLGLDAPQKQEVKLTSPEDMSLDQLKRRLEDELKGSA